MGSKLSELVTKAGAGPSVPEPLVVPVTVRLPYRVADAASRASLRMGVARAQLVRDWAEVGMEAMREALGPDRWAHLVSAEPLSEDEAREWVSLEMARDDAEREQWEADL